MVREPGTSNCPSCDSTVPAATAICPTCGFRLVATTDTQVVLGLLRGDGPAAAARPAPEAMPTERIPLDRLSPALAPPAGYRPLPPMPSRSPDPAPSGGQPDLSVDSLFVQQSAPPAPGAPYQAPPPPAGWDQPAGWDRQVPAAAPVGTRPTLADRLGDIRLPGWLAGGGRPTTPTGPGGSGSTGGRPSRGPLLIALGLVALILVGVTFAIAGLAGSLGSQAKEPVAKAAVPAPVDPTPVDPALISAKASSTLHPDTRGYQARNTLDGRTNTAWNADGDKVGRGVGVTLTWTFDAPQHVRRITVRNGYVRSSKEATVYQNNGRLKRVRITADGTSTEWTLRDTPDPQSIDTDLGSTGSVRFEVLDVYPGAKYKDLALTDISFAAAD